MPSFNYQIISAPSNLVALADKIASAPVIGFDIETTSLSPLDGKIRLLQFNVGGSIFVVDLFKTNGPGPLVQAMRDSKAIWVIQQAKFEQKWLWFHHMVELWPLFDTWRADQLLTNGKEGMSHDIYSIYERYLAIKPEAPDMQKTNWSGELSQSHYDYAAEDVVHLLNLREAMKPLLAKEGLNGIALIEFGVVIAEAETELNGYRLDEHMWRDLARNNLIEAEKLRKQLIHELPAPTEQLTLMGFDPTFNLDSPAQVLVSLRKLGLKQKVRIPDTDTFEWKPLQDTKEMTLAWFAGKYPIVDKFLKYREYSKHGSSFGEEFLENIHANTHRIHCEYFPFTGAGRYACSKPNIQQIPRNKKFRACFRPAEGKVLVLADYSAIEMRIVAEIADDRELIEVFTSGQDAHYATASIIMEKVIAEITKDERQMAKPVNFGFIYGMMPTKLVLYAQANYGVTMTEAQAKKFRDRYFEKYSGIARWHKRVLRDGERSHMARTIGGRLRHLGPDAHNEFMNTPVQGTGADGLKRALRLVTHGLRQYAARAKIVHHVHDEIIAEVDNDSSLIESVKKVLHDSMKEGMAPFLRKVPVLVEPSSGASWAEAK